MLAPPPSSKSASTSSNLSTVKLEPRIYETTENKYTTVDTRSYSDPWKKVMVERALQQVARGEATLEQVAIERFGVAYFSQVY